MIRRKLYIRSAFSFAFAHYHCFSCSRSKNHIFSHSIGQSNLFTFYISFNSLTFNTCRYFTRPMGVWKKYKLMLNHRVGDMLYYSFIYEQFVRLVSTNILRPYLNVPFPFFPSLAVLDLHIFFAFVTPIRYSRILLGLYRI